MIWYDDIILLFFQQLKENITVITLTKLQQKSGKQS